MTTAAANVTVNGLAADRYADLTYARTNFPLVNGTTNFTAIAASSTGLWDTNTVTVDLLATHTFVYDLNGNLISDGKRGLDYDDENQMIRVIATNAFKKEFTYDGVNRLRARREFAWSGSAWVQTNETRFIYDGVLPIQHRDANDIPTLTLTRGLDLSGSFQGAGGVGGVLAVKVGPAVPSGPLANTTHFTCYDGNGNVTALMNAATGEESARYEYAPFAEKLRETGPMAKLNPIRFSTQYEDDYTDDRKWLHRDLRHDRWLNGDPINELGFKLLTERRKMRLNRDGESNRYRFVRNNPIGLIDYLGLIAAGDVINTEFGDVRITRLPTPAEREMGNKAICLVSKLIDISQYPPWDVLWIADMGIEGLNYRGGWGSSDRTEYIFINQSMVPKSDCNLTPMLTYGIVLAHESDHYYNDSVDTEQGATPKPTDTGEKINERAWEAIRKAQASKISCKNCIYAGFWEIKNQLEKYACECGIDLGKCRQD